MWHSRKQRLSEEVAHYGGRDDQDIEVWVEILTDHVPEGWAMSDQLKRRSTAAASSAISH
jgi:hypothetical protein